MQRRKRMSLALAAAGAAVLLPLSASSADAAPTGCSTGGGSIWSTAYCSGYGTGGSYQAWATCYATAWAWTGTYTFVESGWVAAGSGKTATAWCPIDWRGFQVAQRGYSRRN